MIPQDFQDIMSLSLDFFQTNNIDNKILLKNDIIKILDNNCNDKITGVFSNLPNPNNLLKERKEETFYNWSTYFGAVLIVLKLASEFKLLDKIKKNLKLEFNLKWNKNTEHINFYDKNDQIPNNYYNRFTKYIDVFSSDLHIDLDLDEGYMNSKDINFAICVLFKNKPGLFPKSTSQNLYLLSKKNRIIKKSGPNGKVYKFGNPQENFEGFFQENINNLT